MDCSQKVHLVQLQSFRPLKRFLQNTRPGQLLLGRKKRLFISFFSAQKYTVMNLTYRVLQVSHMQCQSMGKEVAVRACMPGQREIRTPVPQSRPRSWEFIWWGEELGVHAKWLPVIKSTVWRWVGNPRKGPLSLNHILESEFLKIVDLRIHFWLKYHRLIWALGIWNYQNLLKNFNLFQFFLFSIYDIILIHPCLVAGFCLEMQGR